MSMRSPFAARQTVALLPIVTMLVPTESGMRGHVFIGGFGSCRAMAESSGTAMSVERSSRMRQMHMMITQTWPAAKLRP